MRQMETRYADVMDRVEHLLSRHRRLSGTASLQEIDDLYTDACAMILQAESERMEMDRQLTDLLDDVSEDPAVVRRSRDLAQRRAQLQRDLVSLRSIAAGLGTASEWLRDPASDEASQLGE
jgi:hypothetical protein